MDAEVTNEVTEKTYWWGVDMRPLEGDEDSWRHCCRGNEANEDPYEMVLRVLTDHNARAETAYRMRVYAENYDTTAPLIEHYKPATAAPEGKPPFEMLTDVGLKVIGDGNPDDFSDHPDHPDNKAEEKITTLDGLVDHFVKTVTAPGYDPELGYQSPTVNISTSELPEDVAEAFGAILDRLKKDREAGIDSDPYRRMVAGATKLNNTLIMAAKHAMTSRGQTSWVQHTDMINEVAKDASAFLFAYTLWVTGS